MTEFTVLEFISYSLGALALGFCLGIVTQSALNFVQAISHHH